MSVEYNHQIILDGEEITFKKVKDLFEKFNVPDSAVVEASSWYLEITWTDR